MLGNALIVSALIGVLIGCPIAPPRRPDMGLVDTVRTGSQAYLVQQQPAFRQPVRPRSRACMWV